MVLNINMDEALMLTYFLEDDSALINIIGHIAVDPVKNITPVVAPEIDNEIDNENAEKENIARPYSIDEFKNHFKMSRGDLLELCALLTPFLPERHVYVSHENKTMFFIWMLTTQETFCAVSKRFGFSQGTGHYAFIKILAAIVELRDQFIKWPTNEECGAIASRIENNYSIPGVVGIIGECQISIRQHRKNAVYFSNSADNEQQNIILQAVCTDKLIFTDVFIHLLGRIQHDETVFRNSPLYELLTEHPPLLRPNQHIIGSAEYPLLTNVLKPFKDNGQILTKKRSIFNVNIRAQSLAIDRAYALLKVKWTRLNFLNMSLLNRIPDVILAACILHNFILLRDEEACGNGCETEHSINYDDIETDLDLSEHNSGNIKRNGIAALLM